MFVDPADPEKMMHAFEKNRKGDTPELMAVLTTHHHIDHSGGNEYFAEKFPGICIIGPDEEISALTRRVSGRAITFGVSWGFVSHL